MWREPRRLAWVALFLSAISFFVYHSGDIQRNLFNQKAQAAAEAVEQFQLTPQRRIHILEGDASGGGHRADAGKPGKSEFPVSWDDEKIISVITRLANNTTLPMRASGRRYWIKTGEEEGLQIRIVLDREKGEIVTAYPLSRESGD